MGDLVGGRYRIEGVLGEGGMAVVFQARHTGTGRACALKLVHPHLTSQPHLVEMFIREAQVGAKIGPNPHIVDVFDAAVDEARGVPYLVMELLQGQTLENWCVQKGPMPPPLVRELFEQLGDALGQAHRAGVVHRDLKPSNLFLVADHRGYPQLKVLDFGIAKLLEADNQRTATQIGTPSYAAPEQFGAMFRPLAERQGITVAAGVSPATDIWPMGLIAYELLLGAPAGQYWDTTTLAELPIKAVLGEQEPASRRAGERAALLPPGFDAWFARCLRKNAPERWPSAGHAVAELTRLLGGAASSGAQLGGNAVPGFTQAGGPPPDAGTPAPYVAPGAPGPFTPASYPPQPYAQGSCTPGPYTQGPHTPGSYPPGPYGPGPYTGAPAQSWPGPAPFPQGPAPFARPGPPKAAGTSPWVGVLVAGGLLALLLLGTVGYAAVRRYNTLEAAHACETRKAQCDEACDGADLPSCERLGVVKENGTGVPKDVTRAAELYKQACDADELNGCVQLGRLHLSGRGGVSRDQLESRRLFDRGCDGGIHRGCTLLGELVRDGDGGAKQDDARALGLFQASCDASDMLGCKDLGAMHEYGRGGLAKSPSHAAALYKQACDGGDAAGCNDLGYLTSNGKGVPKDEVKAIALYKQACEGSEMVGCTNLGVMNEYGKGMLKNEAQAIVLYKQACDGKSGGGCAALGIMYEYGKGGLAKDEARAATLYEQACDAGNASGCFDLGTLVENGKGLAKDEPRAVALYKQACDAGNAFGCTGLGVMTEYGKGGLTKDEGKAGVLYKRACENGSLQACANYGIMLANGRGLDRDQARAATYFKQACDGDNGAGCSNLGFQTVKGLGLPKDRTRGLELLRRGCASGYEWGCEQLKANGGTR